MKVLNIVGTRPNFMKISPLMGKMKKCPKIQPMLVHTGQHYDEGMCQVFFQDLELPKPDVYLGIGSGSHAIQTGKIMIEFERVCIREKPDLVLVVGDVNSTMACSIVAAKLGIRLAHVEAGLRSFDRTMPEEINRIVTDALSDFLFTTCEDADENLKREDIPEGKIFFVGNVMIDTLLKFKAVAEVKAKIKIDKEYYALLTLHRPSNVDDADILRDILEALQEISKKIPIIFPAHPRTQKQIRLFGYERYFSSLDFHSVNSGNLKKGINISGPLSYLEFLNLMANARFALTDSGGIQEETTTLGIPCLIIRDNTERPITIREGTSILVGRDKERIITESLRVMKAKEKGGRMPKLWDGKAAQRIVEVLRKDL